MFYRPVTSRDTSMYWLGDFNSPPPNVVPISEDDFWATFGSGGRIPEYQTGKQVYGKPVPELGLDNPKKFYGLTLWVYRDKTGVGYLERVEHARAAKPIVYFKFAECEHDFRHENIGNCLHRYTCNKCGYKFERDSSG